MLRPASADPPHKSGRRGEPTPADGAALVVLLITEAQAQSDHWYAIQHAFTHSTPDECRNYLASAGYDNDLAFAT